MQTIIAIRRSEVPFITSRNLACSYNPASFSPISEGLSVQPYDVESFYPKGSFALLKSTFKQTFFGLLGYMNSYKKTQLLMANWLISKQMVVSKFILFFVSSIICIDRPYVQVPDNFLYYFITQTPFLMKILLFCRH